MFPDKCIDGAESINDGRRMEEKKVDTFETIFLRLKTPLRVKKEKRYHLFTHLALIVIEYVI